MRACDDSNGRGQQVVGVTAMKWKARISALRLAGVGMVAAGLVLASPHAQAQTQRSFVNPSFEVPTLPGTACWSIRESVDVPGWETTEPSYSGSWGNTNHGTCGGHPDLPVDGAMQIFKNGWDSGLVATDGGQWAELNAFSARRLYQNVCMANGERVDWSLAHRGRSGTQVMQFNIGPDPDGTGAQPIVQARSSTNGGSIDSCGLGTCAYDGTVNTWGTYSGNFIWNGPSGMQTIGFESLTGGSAGNYLDNIRLTLRPYIEFHPANAVTPESGGATGVPALRVAGMIDVPLNVTVEIIGGTATRGVDFSAPAASFVVAIPAGDYGAGAEIPLPLVAIDDALVEDNETVRLRIFEDPDNYAIGNTSVCGAPANEEVVWTLADDDIDLATTKTVDTAAPATGQAFEYTITYANNTARPTTAPLDAHNAVATISDLQPAGISFDSWTCIAAGGAACPAASGSGAIAATALLSAGDAGPGGSLTFVVSATLDAATCDAITNTATIAAPAGLGEGTAAAPDFETPIPGGSANNSASVDVASACADLSIAKSVTPAAAQTGDEVTYTLQVGNGGPNAADGAVVTDPQPAGLDCSTGTLTCGVEAGGAVCPVAPTVAQLQGTGVVIPTLPVGSSLQLTLTCTVTATGNP